MVAALILLALSQVPVGAFGMPELCKVLTTASGKPHLVDAALSDYPVFVSVKSGDPERVRQLVAAAVHGEWKEVEGRFTLTASKVGAADDFTEFQRLYRKACKGDPVALKLPIRDLYEMPIGQVIRYGPTPTPFIRQLPSELAKDWNASKGIYLVRRMAAGVFEHKIGGAETDFEGISESVRVLLRDDLAKQPLTAEEKVELKKAVSASNILRSEWEAIDKRDPIAELHQIVLKPVANALSTDLVLALPDFCLFSLMDMQEGALTVESVLSKYSLCLTWSVIDGAAVGRISQSEVQNGSQAKREVIARLIDAIGKNGVVDVPTLAEYVSNQRPASSDGWTDAMMLGLAGVVIDEEYIGDYPFNIRLYTCLGKEDWDAIRSGQPFAASALSQDARTRLVELMLQSRSRLEDRGQVDPAIWQTLDLSKLTIKAALEEKPVLIGFTMPGGEVSEPNEAGMQYEMRRKKLDHDPLYQPATRRKLTLTISSPVAGEFVTTGFSEVSKGFSKPVVWRQLPAGIAAEFQKGIETASQRGPGSVGKPPPSP